MPGLQSQREFVAPLTNTPTAPLHRSEMTKCHLPRAEDPRLGVVDHPSTDVSRAIAALCQAGSQPQCQHRRLDAGHIVQDGRAKALC